VRKLLARFGALASSEPCAVPRDPPRSKDRLERLRFAMDLKCPHRSRDARGALPELRARGGGALLSPASTRALTGSQFSPVYNIAKFGIWDSFTFSRRVTRARR